MTRRQIEAYGRWVLRKLYMYDWVPNAEFTRTKEPGSVGNCTWLAEERKCWINITPGMTRKNSELTIIHECLHVLYQGHKPEKPKYDPGYELGLNRTAEALWTAWNAKETE